MRIFLSLVVGSWIFCAVGCGGEAPEIVEVCPQESHLTYDNFGRGFLLTWCTGCHSSGLPDDDRQEAPIGVDFDTYDGFMQHRARIKNRAADDVSMPPIGGPYLEQRALLGEWLACDAPR